MFHMLVEQHILLRHLLQKHQYFNVVVPSYHDVIVYDAHHLSWNMILSHSTLHWITIIMLMVHFIWMMDIHFIMNKVHIYIVLSHTINIPLHRNPSLIPHMTLMFVLNVSSLLDWMINIV